MYLSFESGDENPVFKGIQEHDTVMTFMEATADEIHSSLDDTINGQTHYRLVGFILIIYFFEDHCADSIHSISDVMKNCD